MDIPPYVKQACDRDNLTEPFVDLSTGKWFAFGSGAVMAIEIESPYCYNQFGRAESLYGRFQEIALDWSIQSPESWGAAMGRHLGFPSSPSSSHAEMIMSVVSCHFSGAIAEGLLWYAKKNDIEGVIIDSRVSTIQLRSPARKAMYWLNHKIGRWAFSCDMPRNQLLISSELLTESESRINEYPEIQNSKIREVEAFRANSIEELQLHYPNIMRINDRVEVIIPISSNFFRETSVFQSYLYAPAYRNGVLSFERVH